MSIGNQSKVPTIDPTITTVVLWQNGMVMVFDQHGKQMAEYQGRVENVRDKINAEFKGEWQHFDWQEVRAGLYPGARICDRP